MPYLEKPHKSLTKKKSLTLVFHSYKAFSLMITLVPFTALSHSHNFILRFERLIAA